MSSKSVKVGAKTFVWSMAIGITVILIVENLAMDWLNNFLGAYLGRYYPVIIIAFVLAVIRLFSLIHTYLLDVNNLEFAKVISRKTFDTLLPVRDDILADKKLHQFSDAILSEAAIVIRDLGTIAKDTALPIHDEFQRIQIIRHLFLSKPDKEIFALTYDTRDYFMNFWNPVLSNGFLEANEKAAEKAKIIRVFIFNKKDFESNQEKRERFEMIKDSLEEINKSKRIQTHLLWEDQLPSSFPKQSFLIIDHRITSASQHNDNLAYVSFGDKGKLNELSRRRKILVEKLKNYESSNSSN
ncbi:MAG: hypothetical protein NTW29_06270 [Bacteroidetes bacterium]|nr:hypothetical protein [Bacteroidota bacterium]